MHLYLLQQNMVTEKLLNIIWPVKVYKKQQMLNLKVKYYGLQYLKNNFLVFNFTHIIVIVVINKR